MAPSVHSEKTASPTRSRKNSISGSPQMVRMILRKRRLNRLKVTDSRARSCIENGWFRVMAHRQPKCEWTIQLEELPIDTYESTLTQLPLYKHIREGGSVHTLEIVVPCLKDIVLDSKDHVERQYTDLLDLYDKLWVELRFVHWANGPDPSHELPLYNGICQVMRRITACIRHIERSPEIYEYNIDFRELQDKRVSRYSPNHPLRAIRQYLRPAPDFSPVLGDADPFSDDDT